MPRSSRRSSGSAALIGLFAVAAALGVVSGALFAYAPDLPQIVALDDYAPNTITRVEARGGELIGEFAVQRRVIIGYDDIPEVLRQAIIAAEDDAFFAHNGISVPGIIRAAIQDVLRGELFSGASTLTMQLARNVEVGGRVLGREKVWKRKFLEMYYAIHLEKRYTKPEILALYANQVWLGTAMHAADGVEAAAQLLFGKSARDVELGEAAVIAGIIQGPSRVSPLVNMDAATDRRNYALRRMAEEDFITEEVAAEEMAKPIVLAPRQQRSNTIAPYFLEEIRQHLENEYGARRLYHDGLVVRSTLDIDLQRAANRAVADGLRALDKRQGYRGPRRNVLSGDDASPTVEDFEHPQWIYPMEAGDVVPAVVTDVRRNRIGVRAGPYRATIEPEGFSWTRRNAAELVERGDLVDVRITTLPHAPRGVARATLDQEPAVEAALVALDNRTGRVLAMVGGYDFDRSKFNRATQAYRQLGSLFKGVLYAAAIDQGYTPTSMVMDQPVAYEVGPGQPRYRPTNYDHKYEGPITLRRALEKSRNVPAVWMMDAVGPETVVDFARRVGFTAPIPPYLSVALGSAEATLMEVTSAYSVFPNGGQRMIPFQIERVRDREGRLLEENRPQSRDALRADTAYVMVSLMRGVVQRGTAQRARRELDWPVGGKTGTMDDYTDAWFVGFDPDVTVGVWVGYDEKRSLGHNEEGARVALPIWIEFLKAYGADRESPPDFQAPGNIVIRTVDEMTGEQVARGGRGTIQEVFIAGTEPGATFRR
ncbi:MAG: PBP1A family penicillin-binding protein [Acidobacteria bacterium]|nr:PBP1A family penicillin-binding protein [Acidobacteriota bacterium]